jgi:threonine synthase
MDHTLECLDCAKRVPATVTRLRCHTCAGLFRIAYSTAADAKQQRLPLSVTSRTVSLGEGRTALLRLDRTARALGLGDLWAKLEFIAPTGSFKDRGSAVLISAALAEGVTEFVEDSSGNAGASLSAYAAAAAMKAHVFVPADAASGKLDQIRIFGAELHLVEGPRQAATDAAEKFVAEHELPYLSHNLSPYFSDGMKAVAYELHLGPARDAGHVVLPVGNGSLLIGATAGFDELAEAGVVDSRPKFHAVQAQAVQPITAAINGDAWDSSSAAPTVASGIAVGLPPRLNQCVAAVRESGGSAVAVADSASLNWQRKLARVEGIFCEATAATAFAGLQQLITQGAISPGESVVVPITGSGLKDSVPS